MSETPEESWFLVFRGSNKRVCHDKSNKNPYVCDSEDDAEKVIAGIEKNTRAYRGLLAPMHADEYKKRYSEFVERDDA